MDSFFGYFNYDSKIGFNTNTPRIHTGLPRNSAIVRIAITVLSTAFALTKISSPAWFWRVAVVGFGFAGWTIYSSFIRKDPLISKFHELVGGEANFNKLPKLSSPTKKTTFEDIQKIKWDDLKAPIYRGKTKDGREVVILKALDQTERVIPNSGQKLEIYHYETVCAFVEKMDNRDAEKTPFFLALFFDAIQAFYSPKQSVCNLGGDPEPQNRYYRAKFIGKVQNRSEVSMHDSISSEMAENFSKQYSQMI